MTDTHLLICRGPDCLSRGAQETYTAFTRELEALGVSDERVVQSQCGCVGPLCGRGPAVCVYPDGTWYAGVSAADAAEVAREHLVGGRPVKRLVAKRLEGRP